MAPRPRRFELEDAVTRPGTYFNPTTEMLIVVDDGAAIDAAIVDAGDDADEWVLVSEGAPVDETTRDELIERFESRYGSGPTGAVAASEDDEEELDDLDELGDVTDPADLDDDPYGGPADELAGFEDDDERY
jgi:hypothetical protein